MGPYTSLTGNIGVLSANNRPKTGPSRVGGIQAGGGILFQSRFRSGGEGSAWDFDLAKVNPGRAPMVTILFISLSAAQNNFEADWVETDGGTILRQYRFVCAIPSSAMDAGANRPTMKTMTGFRFGAASAICAGRRSPSCRLSLHPTATTASSPAGRRCDATLGNAAAGKLQRQLSRPRTRDRSIHSAPMVSKSGFLSAAVFVLTLCDARPSLKRWMQAGFSLWATCGCAGKLYSLVSSGSGLYGSEKKHWLCFRGSAKVVEAMRFPNRYRQVTEKERDHDPN